MFWAIIIVCFVIIFLFWKGNKTSPLNDPVKCMNKTWLTKGGKKKEKTWNASAEKQMAWTGENNLIHRLHAIVSRSWWGLHNHGPHIFVRHWLQTIVTKDTSMNRGETLLSRVVISKALVIWLSWINSRVVDWLEVAGQRKLDKHQRTAWHAQVSSWATLHIDIGPMSCFMFV